MQELQLYYTAVAMHRWHQEPSITNLVNFLIFPLSGLLWGFFLLLPIILWAVHPTDTWRRHDHRHSPWSQPSQRVVAVLLVRSRQRR